MRQQQRHLADGAWQQEAGRPEQDRRQKQIAADRRAMRFLSALHLRQKITTEGDIKERPVSRQRHQHRPGKRDKTQDEHTAPGAQHAKPSDIAMPCRQRGNRRQRQHRGHRSLDQHRRGHRQPHPQIGMIGQPAAMLPGPVDPHQPVLLHQAQQHQHRIRLCQMCLGTDNQRTTAGRRRQHGALRFVERSRNAESAIDRQQHGKQAWQPIGRDVILAEH